MSTYGELKVSIKLQLSRISADNSESFKDLGMKREAKICQLRAEMFAARAEELQLPNCKCCGRTLSKDSYIKTLCRPCMDWAYEVIEGMEIQMK